MSTTPRPEPARWSGRSLRSPALWTLVALFAVELFLFDRFGSHRFTAIFPRWNDQIQYLGEAYTGHEYARTHGLVAGLWQTLVNGSAQGTLHDFAATLLFAVTGPSRSAALALNLLALLAWQSALWIAVARLTGSRPFAFAAAALPLALCGPWADIPGSAYDFRLDHFALCALGVTSAVALLTDGFRSRRWSLIFGATVAVTLLTRFLTGTYFAVIFTAAAVWILCGRDKKLRTAHLALAALVAFVLAAPLFWLNREWVWNYYWIGHYVGPESAIRNQHFGLGQSLSFVGGQLAERHLGPFFGALALLGTLAFWVSRRRDSPHQPNSADHPDPTRSCERQRVDHPSPSIPTTSPDPSTSPTLWFFAFLFLLAPAFILTLHQQKSEVVVGALAPGVVLLVIAAWHLAARPGPSSGRGPIVAAVIVVLAALSFFAQRQLHASVSASDRAQFRVVNTLADTILRRSRAAKLPQTRVAVDYITDALDAQVLRVIAYERHHEWLPFSMTLPTGIAAPTEAEVMARLEQSDFVFLTEDAPPGGFPYDEKLLALRPKLRVWCETHLRPTDRFTYFNRRMVLYQRREIPFP